LLGASVAFFVLNAMAVIFGAEVATWLPERVTAGIVAVLFGAFGIHALRRQDDEVSNDITERPGHGIFFSTLLLILVAEFGDKTQVAVAGLAGTMSPLPVWIGASAALVLVSALGVWAGRTVLQRLPIIWLHRISGGIFLSFAILAALRAVA
jgi:putative Ca2+/H+ antiporter (TMEM165/GDT1 family)